MDNGDGLEGGVQEGFQTVGEGVGKVEEVEDLLAGRATWWGCRGAKVGSLVVRLLACQQTLSMT